jgi:hypothetical protein
MRNQRKWYAAIEHNADFIPWIDTTEQLYSKMVKSCGESVAKYIFANAGRRDRSVPKSKQKVDKHLELVRRLLAQPEGPNKYRLRKSIIAENEASGIGSTDPEVIKKQINRAVEIVQKLDAMVLVPLDDGWSSSSFVFRWPEGKWLKSHRLSELRRVRDVGLMAYRTGDKK